MGGGGGDAPPKHYTGARMSVRTKPQKIHSQDLQWISMIDKSAGRGLVVDFSSESSTEREDRFPRYLEDRDDKQSKPLVTPILILFMSDATPALTGTGSSPLLGSSLRGLERSSCPAHCFRGIKLNFGAAPKPNGSIPARTVQSLQTLSHLPRVARLVVLDLEQAPIWTPTWVSPKTQN